ncbi:putative MFS family arabinose efflux permease [Sphingobium sp. OAS761]|uniref:spinster family MFS transporter n=1 Tax=Sphingobium sp. OAS761 TaxID=2817901 RepID=UPI00209CE919|nr:MFS transporter [Sphingobium sp. OAS761]MCP1470328.1 putative MFS family arabinose efflux permease [Sphingobium sp. OAS761]
MPELSQPAAPRIASEPTADAGVPRERGPRTAMLLMLAFIYSLNYLDRQIVIILQEPIKHDFQLADWELGLLTGGAFGIFYTAMGIPIANIIDKGVNRVRLIAGFTAVWSIMTAVCGITRNFAQFFTARMGVGLAEAGFAPAAHSLISDLYEPRERPAAAGLFAIGVPIGMMAGLSIGGVVAQYADWRTALLLAGIPGVLIALIFPFVAREPTRGGTDAPVAPGTAPARLGFMEGLKLLARRSAFVHVIAGSAAFSFAQAGIATWLPSFLIRTHGMSLAQVGLSLGVISGLCGAIGTWFGGWQGTRFGRAGLHAIVRLPIIGIVLAAPLYVLVLNMGSGFAALMLLVAPVLLGAFWTAPSIALTQSLAPVAMRARASAVYIVAANLIGVSMGPLVAGALSDWFTNMNGGDAARGLRDALMLLTLFMFIGAGHWAYVGRLLKREGTA